jgi:hypothetical protein
LRSTSLLIVFTAELKLSLRKTKWLSAGNDVCVHSRLICTNHLSSHQPFTQDFLGNIPQSQQCQRDLVPWQQSPGQSRKTCHLALGHRQERIGFHGKLLETNVQSPQIGANPVSFMQPVLGSRKEETTSRNGNSRGQISKHLPETPQKSQKWTFHDIYPTHWPYIKHGFSLGRKVAGDNHQEVVYRQHKRVILTQKNVSFKET